MLLADQPLGIDQCTCSAMRKASRQITRLYDSHLEPVGLRITQFLMLAALEEAGGATVNTLAERLDIERTAMGKMLGFLERDDFVAIMPAALSTARLAAFAAPLSTAASSRFPLLRQPLAPARWMQEQECPRIPSCGRDVWTTR